MNINDASKILSLISDPNRLVVVTLLVKNRKMSANEFLSSTTCKQATLSHHLNEMVDAELLKCKKKGNKVFYSLNICQPCKPGKPEGNTCNGSAS